MADGAQSKSVEVLLATYNGENFLRELLESLLQQSFQEFTVLVSDDGSNDGTTAILETFEANHPGRFLFLPPSTSRLGASANFGRLIMNASADYLFFCDQDDVWLPNKMEATLARMAALESRYHSNIPLLVHTDLAVVGSKLELISSSFFRYLNIEPHGPDYGTLIWRNIASGCTILINRSLYIRARPFPDHIMYDHWLALVATVLGKIECVPEPTILYRQHGRNVIGAQKANKKGKLLQRIIRPFRSAGALNSLTRQSRLALLFFERYKLLLRPNQLAEVATMAGLQSIPRHMRFIKLWRNRLLRPTFLGNLSLFVLVLRIGKPPCQSKK